MVCNQCGGEIRPTRVDLDVSRTPELIPVMLACVECGRPTRLLHRTRPKGLSKSDVRRHERAQRRFEMRGGQQSEST